MVRSMLLGLLAILLMGAAPADLEPRGYVNDFADIIPDEREAVIEQKISDFEKVTTMEIAVVTTPSLDGSDIQSWSTGLAQSWGVGKKGNDNGIMFVVAPNEREWRIDTGYGVGAFLVDHTAARYGNEILPDYFKAGDYGGGIEAMVDKIIAHIGMLSPAEQQELIVTKRQQAQKEAGEKIIARALFYERLGNFLGALFTLALTVFGFFRVRRFLKRQEAENKRLDQIKSTLRSAQDSITEQAKRFSENPLASADERTSQLPAWILSEADTAAAVCAGAEAQLQVVLKDFPPLKRKNLTLLEKRMTKMETLLASTSGAMSLFDSLSEKVAAYRQGAKNSVETAAQLLHDVKTRFSALTGAGDRVDTLLTAAELEELSTSTATLKAMLASRVDGVDDNSDQIANIAEYLRLALTQVRYELSAFATRSTEAVTMFHELPKAIAALDPVLHKHRETIGRLETILPSEALASVRFGSMVSDIEMLKVEVKTLDLSQAHDVSTLESFHEKVSTLSRQCVAIQSSHRQAADLERETLTARKAYPDEFAELESALSVAKREVNDSDVEDNAKSLLRSAQEKHDQAELEASKPLVDWLFVLTLVHEGIALSKRAEAKAEEDKEDAARAQRRRQQQAAQRSSSSSSSGSGSSSSRSSGGFKGFGGGGFGGGGAGGKW